MSSLVPPRDVEIPSVLPPIEPIGRMARAWTSWSGIVVTLAMLGAIAWHLRDERLGTLFSHLPASPGFWLLFVVFYMTLPVADWLIFRRLWGLPIGGLVPLMKKRVSNDLVLGYSGEVYFYGWARQNLSLKGSPFGAVKDVTILSAMMGNLVTLILVIGTAPILLELVPNLNIEVGLTAVLVSLSIIVAISLIVAVMRHKVFSLSATELRQTAAIHLARLLISIAVSAFMWHMALPQVAVGWWLVLASWRQLVARLPLLPNKDVLFAAVAVFLMGEQNGVGALMALIATLLLATNLLVAGVLAGLHLWRGSE